MVPWAHVAAAGEPAEPWQAEPFAEQVLRRGDCAEGSELASAGHTALMANVRSSGFFQNRPGLYRSHSLPLSEALSRVWLILLLNKPALTLVTHF